MSCGADSSAVAANTLDPSDNTREDEIEATNARLERVAFENVFDVAFNTVELLLAMLTFVAMGVVNAVERVTRTAIKVVSRYKVEMRFI